MIPSILQSWKASQTLKLFEDLFLIISLPFITLFKVDLSDSENELEEEGADVDTGGGSGKTESGGVSSGYDKTLYL